MSDRDPSELADELEREADHLERPSRELEGRVKALRDDWERKRADQSVPGAAPPEGNEGDDESDEPSSQAPDAPAPEAGPSQAGTPSEGAAGPPADTGN